MSDYSVVEVDGAKTLGVFDNYRDARDFHKRFQKEYTHDWSLDLLCMHPCGCLYLARFTREALVGILKHTDWSRREVCRRHVDDEAWAMYGHNDAALETEEQRQERRCICMYRDTGASPDDNCPRHGKR